MRGCVAMSWTEGSNRKQIYVSGLPKDITEKELVEKFGQVGPIAKDPKRARFDPGAKKVWLYTDRNTRKPKGDGTITYADEDAASAAVQFFDGQEMPGWDGQKLHVSIAQRKEGWDQGKRWAGASCAVTIPPHERQLTRDVHPVLRLRGPSPQAEAEAEAEVEVAVDISESETCQSK